MKPIFDLSKQNSFTVWESCVQRQTFSSSVLVAGTASEKLQVIYEKDPTRSSTHYLFYANVGSILAGCFISKPRGKSNVSMVRVELFKVEVLRTKTVQGETQPDAVLVPLHLVSRNLVLDTSTDLESLIGEFEDRPSLPNARELMHQAIVKAMTPPESQRLFWGVPRVKNED